MCKMESVGESVLTGAPTQDVKVVSDGASGKKSAEYVKYTAFHPVLAISNRSLCERPFLEQIERVCKLRPDALVLREKDLSPQEYKELAEQVLEICGEYQVPCILHSFWREALELGCDQIHLPLHLLRGLDPEAKKKFRVIGTSIHAVEEAVVAQSLGATYLTAGHIYTTDCKKGLAPRGLEFLRQVCESVELPVFAIGGIKFDPEQWQEIREAKAVGGCIMSGMMQV